MDFKKRHATLRKMLSQAREDYYLKNQSPISDDQFDSYMIELITLEQEHPELVTADSPSRQVGPPISADFAPSEHLVPMLSLDNVFSTDALEQWLKRMANDTGAQEELSFTVEPKIDGLAINLLYNWPAVDRDPTKEDPHSPPPFLVLNHAATRGDGKTGETVSRQIRTVQDVPLFLVNPDITLPESIELRGEIYMSKPAFEQMNAERQRVIDYYESLTQEQRKIQQLKTPDALAKTARNAAAGALRRKDPKETAEFSIGLFVHGFGKVEPSNFFKNQTDFWEWCTKLGLPMAQPAMHTSDPQAIVEHVAKLTEERDSLDYGIDGVVVKVNAVQLQEQLGSTARAPRWGIAYKMPPLQRETELLAINLTVGRTGKVTPNALIAPVTIEGITIEHVSLHNELSIHKKDVRIGDHVWVRRAADIIPEVVGPVLQKRKADSQVWTMPSHCPECGEPLIRELDDQGHHFCLNTDCPVKLPESLTYLAQRSVLDIEGLATKRIDALCTTNIVTSISDIFTLHTPATQRNINQLIWSWLRLEDEGFIGELQPEISLSNEVGTNPKAEFDKFSEHASASPSRHHAKDMSVEDIAKATFVNQADLTVNLGRKIIELKSGHFHALGNIVQPPDQEPDLANTQTTEQVAGFLAYQLANTAAGKAKFQEQKEELAKIGFRVNEEGWPQINPDFFSYEEVIPSAAGQLFSLEQKQEVKPAEQRKRMEKAWKSLVKLVVNDDIHTVGFIQDTLYLIVPLKSWNDVLKQIELSYLQPFYRWLAALGIPLLGPSMAERLSVALPSIAEIEAADIDKIQAINGFSVGKAQRIIDWFANPHNKALVAQLCEIGMPSKVDETTLAAMQTMQDLPFRNNTFVLTGNFTFGDREDLSQQLANLGAKVTTSVSGKTSALIAGTEPGAKKIQQAEQRKIPILNAQQLEQLLQGTPLESLP